MKKTPSREDVISRKKAISTKSISNTSESTVLENSENESRDVTYDPLQEFFVSENEKALMTKSFVSGGTKGDKKIGKTEQTLELLAFWVADEEYAISIIEIQEIIKVQPITELPRAGSAVLGIISLRGTIVPILDLRRVLHLEERPISRQTRILVVRSEDDPIGLLVDRVTSVTRFDAKKVEATPHAMRRQTSEFVRGVGRLDSRLFIILEVSSVIAIMDAAA
ncbi:MAG: purine-binding chemotaxis protein CheW [Deltaproteobacteria bacterium]|nr:purine-binding chemotaxis protein CheW [Deltaproteobacteria bacterium]